ncbi:hypothetical protein GT370_13935 [Acidocella sp. MX-AZ03]|uniref:hypothetical protein n=1 Tax=Acidocella sp. MX-AZ03 TaxID=2697363 RepID=UPI0022DE778D|nr:hypothetical protein [Acidocella sp. MX-AZ03]WBO58301.1 hypothetical protein GT370_13935 [Acidocella sp. MX-AZ03]
MKNLQKFLGCGDFFQKVPTKVRTGGNAVATTPDVFAAFLKKSGTKKLLRNKKAAHKAAFP